MEHSNHNAMLKNLQPPQVDLATLQDFAEAHFGLRGQWKRLQGERDLNYQVSEDSGPAWVFKLCNPHESAALFECQTSALEHIARTDAGLPVPRVQRTVDGKAMATLHANGADHCVIVLSFLPGDVIGDASLSAAQLHEVGQLVARLGKALRGFIHPAPAARHLAWDHRRLPDLAAHVDVIAPAQRQRARQIISAFCAKTLPKLETMRSQIIHGDVHPFNTLMLDGEITGIIDFGDMVHGALVQDVANTVADYMEGGTDLTRVMRSIVAGYCSVTPLEEAEVDVILPLIESRLLMTPLIVKLRADGGSVDNGYLEDFARRANQLLDEIAAQREGLITAAREAAGFSVPKPLHSVAEMLERRRAAMGNRLYMFYDTPLHMVKGEGLWLTAADGRRYLDCYNNVPHVGHCHPRVVETITRQIRVLNTNTRYLSEQSLAYAERLTATLDKSLSAVVYVNSGSEANDVAWRMAKAWTGKHGGLAMEFAYHGITDAIDAFSPSNSGAFWHAPHIRLLPPPDDYRGPYKRGDVQLAERYAALADAPIAQLQEEGLGVAAAMVDSAFMTNGMIEAPQGYLSGVVEKVRAAGGLFIADEVQSGFGRMGTAMWGHQHHGVVPDFVTIGKPAGNGHPLGVVITRPEILDHFTQFGPFFSTFGGNNVSCAAGLAVLDVIRDEGLIDNAREAGAYFKDKLKGLMAKHAIIGDVRGTGLALGMELVRDRKTLEPAAEETSRLINLIRDEGVLVGSEGILGNIVKLRPPIVFKREHADQVVAAVDRALAKV